MTDSGHLPVLAAQVVALLITDTRGAYLDLTIGGGGHVRAMARALEPEARMYGVDADPAAVARCRESLAGLAQFREVIHSDFGSIAERVASEAQMEDRSFDGILLDLGISSYQLDDPERGISFRFDGPLDMRFNPEHGEPAHDLLNRLSEKELTHLLREFGEERQAAKIARAIVRERDKGMILTTARLRDVVIGVIRPPHQNKSLARVFQALRIAVNHELEQLDSVLPSATGLLKPGGRLAVISYHSLEDRRVKRFFQDRSKAIDTTPYAIPGQDVSGPRLRLVTRKPVSPDESEIDTNPRARSARLRVAERVS